MVYGGRVFWNHSPTLQPGIRTVSIPGKTNYPIEELFLDLLPTCFRGLSDNLPSDRFCSLPRIVV